MSAKTITTVRFHNYWKLLNVLAPWFDMVIVFNESGHFIWQSNRQLHPQMDRISVLVKNFQQQSRAIDLPRSVQKLNDIEVLELNNLSEPSIECALTIALISKEYKTVQNLSPENEKSLQLLNQTLLTEYALIQKIIEKEQELVSMADELTHRYEELNLIYSSDDNVQNLTHGRDLLNQIIINASNYLDVDLATIILPDKNVTLHHGRQAYSARCYTNTLDYLRNEVYLQLKIQKRSFVINHFDDANSLNVFLELPHKTVVSPLLNVDNEVIGLMAIINQNNRIDFTNSDRNLLEVLANKASNIVSRNFDPLTGLENSHSFELIVKDTLKQSWQNDNHHAVANIDIDRMAVINDISGLEAGDLLIKKVSRTLTKMIRSYDTAARLGGDKFAVLLKNCDLEKAHEIMKKVAEVISQIELEWNGTVHEVSVSIGLAPITADLANVSSVLSNAESARLAAKERGRNQIQVFKLNDSDLLRRKDQIQWVSRTQSALRENRFQLFAQLICPISASSELPHFEILIRMLDDDNHPIEPVHFLAAAENFFLMPKIDRWVITNTFHYLKKLHDEYGTHVCQVSINLSGQSLTDKNLARFITDLLEEYQLDPQIICFEVTESAAVANLADAQYFINEIRARGCKFSLDDFGTGQSSFSYLKNLPVDYLKIDGSFVKSIVEDSVSLSMVSAINQVGHAMNLKTVAEFVENDNILERLREVGIDYAQGYAIDEPQPFSDILHLLQEPAEKVAQ